MFLDTMSRDCRSSGRTPRTSAPRVWLPAVTSAWRSRVRLTVRTPGKAFSLASSSGVACTMPPSRAVITMWPFRPMMRPRSCWRKPPITDSTMIRVATPSATPISEKMAMKETKPSRWRVAR